MGFTKRISEILSCYEGESPGVKGQLARILTHGRLGGSGRVIILPVDQGFEHGPARSFAINPVAYDPQYHCQLATEAGLSAFAAPLGMLEVSAGSFAGQIPTILKLNNANSLVQASERADQAITGSVSDALRLGCAAVGFTIYPGSGAADGQYEEVREIASQAKRCGLAVVIWAYPRGGLLSSKGETALDVVAYAAHMAALLGAHIIKVKMPTAELELPAAAKVYRECKIPLSTMRERVAHIVQCAFAGRRIVVFSGGGITGDDDLLAQAEAIRDGGGHGSIIGRNIFQRERTDALALLDKLVNTYR